MILHTISVKASQILIKNSSLPLSESKVRYGIEIVLTTLCNLLLITLTAFFFHVLEETLTLFSSYVLLRVFAGGVHLTSYYRCVLFGLLLFIGGSSVSSFIGPYMGQAPLIIMITITALLALYVCSKYSPALFQYRKFTEDKAKRLKKYSLCVIFFWTPTMISLSLFLTPSLIMASTLGILIQLWMMTPHAYRFITVLEGKKKE